MSLAKLQQQRKTLVGRVTIVQTGIGFHTSKPLTDGQVAVYRDELTDISTKLHLNLDKIRDVTDDVTFPPEEKEYFTIIQAIQKCRADLLTILPTPVPSSASTPRSVQRPSLELPTFSGHTQDWTSFYSIFKASVEDDATIPTVDKLQYLIRCTKDEAHSMIKNYPIVDANFATALKLLKDRYENVRVIVHNNIEQILLIPPLHTESSDGLYKIINTTNQAAAILRQQGETVDGWSTLLAHLLLKKLDSHTRTLYDQQQTTANTIPKMQTLIDFLKKRASSLSVTGVTAPKRPTAPSRPGEKPPVNKKLNVHYAAVPACPVCTQTHWMTKCPKFLSMTIAERRDFVRSSDLCFNCMRPGHSAKFCISGECRTCQKKHHSLLHQEEDVKEVLSGYLVTETSPVVTRNKSVLLATALVKIPDSNGQDQLCRAFLDTGSQATFMTEGCCQRLRLQRTHSSMTINGVGQTSARTKGLVSFTLKSHYDVDFKLQCNAHILTAVTGLMPSRSVAAHEWPHLSSLHLADPKWYQSDKIDLLLGADVYYRIQLPKAIESQQGSPTAQLTALGWILGGCVHEGTTPAINTFTAQLCPTVEDKLQQFWTMEEVTTRTALSQEEKSCEEHFQETVKRDLTGRYIVNHSFNPKLPLLVSNRDIALKRFYGIERRLGNEPELKAQYKDFMHEYLALGHMQKIDSKIDIFSPRCFYLPHHPVLRPEATTTKCRVVFDASAKGGNNISLNDTLMVGPKVQQDLIPIILRFRTHLIALKADIEKMFRQIKIEETHQDYQRIIWRDSPTDPIKDYRLLTVTYGTADAPFHATRVLKQLAMDEKENYPEASAVAETDFYMDDLLSGATSTEEATRLQEQISSLLCKGGFTLKKCASNDTQLIESLPLDMREVNDSLDMTLDPVVKTLGLQWHPSSDNFTFKLSLPLCSPNSTITKREFLSQMARLFDPLGWLAPMIIKGKILFQDIWRHGTNWDEALPEEFGKKWERFKDELPSTQHIKIPRCILHAADEVHELHGFCDASEKAFAAVLYLRTLNSKGKATVYILFSKTRVAPNKKVSLPRLELCGALLLSKMITVISTAMSNVLLHDIRAWSDSTVTLHWIKSDPNKWQTFVANRVSQIQDVLHPSKWHHVSGKNNPADVASRGIYPSEMESNKLWWHGPDWLQESTITYPIWHNEAEEGPITIEARKQRIEVYSVITDYIFYKYSSFSKMKRVTAYLLRFAKNTRLKPEERKFGFLSADELDKALNAIIRVVQTNNFLEEIESCKNNEPVLKKSKLLKLSPFLDSNGILRVGGRINQGDFEYEKKHPAILPGDEHVSKQIIKHYHLKLLHSGPTLTLAGVQSQFWIMNGKRAVKKVINACVTCSRFKATTQLQFMGELPATRLKRNSTFTTVGLDFAGPLYVRDRAGRGVKITKNYLAVFVCFSTHAIHLELVEDMSKEACLDAITAFCSRRGKPHTICCDQGTNLVGASNELKAFLEAVQSEPYYRTLGSKLAKEGINFKFNPPSAPHHGGLWEAAVKSAKHHLYRTIGTSSLTRSQFHVLLTSIEAILNSRPLCPMNLDSTDLEVLTPAHFLIQRPLTAYPEPDLTDLNEGRLSQWQRVHNLAQFYWKRWSNEYITTLQKRTKWTTAHPNIRMGTMVILKDDNQPPLRWKLGRVIALHPGPDGYIRVVTVKTATGELRRPIVKLSVLPVDIDEEHNNTN